VKIVKKYGSLTVRLTDRAGAKAGFNDLHILNKTQYEFIETSNRGDNSLMSPSRSNLRRRLPPRCRLVTSSSCSRLEGSVCSSGKVAREMGAERREPVWFLSRLIVEF